jgi:hypothetical protein
MWNAQEEEIEGLLLAGQSSPLRKTSDEPASDASDRNDDDDGGNAETKADAGAMDSNGDANPDLRRLGSQVRCAEKFCRQQLHRLMQTRLKRRWTLTLMKTSILSCC